MLDHILPLIENHVRNELKTVDQLCKQDPEKYGLAPQEIYLMKHQYIQPIHEPAPWELHTQRGLLRAISTSQKARYGKREWKTPPEVGRLPISRAWKLESDQLASVHPAVLGVAVLEKKDAIGNRDRMFKMFKIVRVRFTYSDDGLEVYMDSQWSPMRGSGLTFEVTPGSMGAGLRYCMRRWSS